MNVLLELLKALLGIGKSGSFDGRSGDQSASAPIQVIIKKSKKN